MVCFFNYGFMFKNSSARLRKPRASRENMFSTLPVFPDGFDVEVFLDLFTHVMPDMSEGSYGQRVYLVSFLLDSSTCAAAVY
jgi:hypothetical protein